MTRRRWAAAVLAAAVLLGLVLVAGLSSTLVVLAPVGEVAFALACEVWVLLLVALVLYRPSRRQVLLGAVPVFVAGYVTVGVAYLATIFDTDGDVVRTVRAGDHDVRIVTNTGFLDPEWHVRVRSRHGLLSREWTVEEVQGPDPVAVVVTGERSVRVTDVEGRVYDVTF